MSRIHTIILLLLILIAVPLNATALDTDAASIVNDPVLLLDGYIDPDYPATLYFSSVFGDYTGQESLFDGVTYELDLYSVDQKIGSVNICFNSVPENDEGYEVDSFNYFFEDIHILDEPSFAFSGSWDPLPRKPVLLDPNTHEYDDEIELAYELTYGYYSTVHWQNDHGWNYDLIKTTPYRICQIMSIDLNNDGVDEIILNLEIGGNWLGESTRTGELPILVSGSEVIPIDVSDFSQFLGGSTGEPLGPSVELVVDSNGDGNMEIIYYTGCCGGQGFRIIDKDEWYTRTSF